MKKLITMITLLALVIGLAVAANAAVGTVVYGYKTDKAPNLDEIDDSWGEPAVYVSVDSPNAQRYKFWDEYEDTAGYEHGGTGPNGRTTIQPEPSDFWLYALYDSKNIYIGVKSPDVEPCGSETIHRGDGIHMWFEPMDVIIDPTASNGDPDADEEKREMLSSMYSYYLNLAFNDYDVDTLFASKQSYTQITWTEDGYLHCIVAIPLANYGLKGQNLHGMEFGITVRRVSSKSPYDEGYAGWLQWGVGMKNYTPLPTSMNTLVLVDPAQGEVNVEIETIPVETDAPETDAPETQAPETEAPETEAPETDAPETDAPETDAPETDAPETDAPETDAPETEAPETEAPETDAPETDAPETDAPETEAPETDAPETDAPETDAPETDAPATDAPAATPAEPAKNNTGLIVGIVAAVVVVGAIVGVVVGKKKK